MSIKVTPILRALGLGFVLVAFISGCGTPEITNSPKVSPPVETVEKQDTTTDASDSLPKTLNAESMISASQLDEGIKAKKTWQIIDVREPIEFATGHVPQAINIPLGTIETQTSEIAKDRDVILICHTGSRAFTAWQTLLSKGYDPHRLKVLLGGMEQWKTLGSGEVTESIGGC